MSRDIYVLLVAILVSAALVYAYRLLREKSGRKSLRSLRNDGGLQQAVILPSKSGPYNLTMDHQRPKICSREVLIRNKAIGLNPIDWKCVTYGFGVYSIPWISGREAAGVIEEIGADVKNFERGERVWVTSTNYRDNRTSTFQEYMVALPHNIGRLPDFISFEEGATLGVASVAAAAALYDALSIPREVLCPQEFAKADATSECESRAWVLIWGASCATGMMAVQLAKQSGLAVFAVAGLQNSTQLRSLGADRLLDRYKPQEAISEAQTLNINMAIDCVGQETATFAAKSLKRGGKLAYLVKKPSEVVSQAYGVEATDILIKRFHEDEHYARGLVELLENSLQRRTIRPVKHEMVPGGFSGIQVGLDRLRKGAVSGRKLVVRV